MRQENRESLEKYRSHYNQWVGSKNLLPMNGGENEILRIIREEWDANYHVDMWCGHCQAKMLVYAFERSKTDVVKIKL